MEVDIDVYFWLVDRGVYDDDQRNKVDMERNKVRLHREHSQRLENGYYLAKLMMILKKSVVKISRKPFSLDPNLANMKDNITSASKQTNWNIICKELKKFGIRVDSEKRQKILEGRYQIICEILSGLFEFDNGGGQGRIGGDAASEMNYGPSGALTVERDPSSGPPGANNNPNDSSNISIEGGKPGDSSIIVGLSAQKRQQLDPLSPGKLKNQSKLPLNLVSPSPNMRKIKGSTVNQSVTSLNDISDSKELNETETTLEFILLGLAKNLGIKPKQAAGLLSNNHKYLIHIAVKGMKGNDYSKVLAWYQNIYGFAKHIVSLIDVEKDHNAMKLTLNILKCGLYSLNTDLVITCARVLSKIGQEINLVGGQLSGLAWDWFVDNANASTGDQQQQPPQRSSIDESSIARDLSPGGLINLPQGVLNESGLASCLYAMRKNKSDGVESIAPLFIHYGRNNYTEFFTYHLRRHFPGDPMQRINYFSCVHDVAMAIGSTSMFQDALVQTGVIDELISQAIRMADFDPNGGNSPKERATAIAFLADVWELKSDRIDENPDVAQAILTVLKRGCRDRTRILRTVSFEQMFKLLSHFSLSRNQFAPIIYKSLTFLLIEFHQHVEIREQLMRQFGTLFQQIQTIPVAILCEPLLKQIAIAGGSTPESTMDFNIFDFEFFGVVANHKRATVGIGLQIVDTMVQQATSQVFYANSATSIVLELLHRFNREQPMHKHIGKITESLVQQLDESERWKKANSLSPPQNESLRKARSKGVDPQQSEQQTIALARKMRERLIVNFLKQLILFGVEMVKENLRTQLLRMYSRLENSGKVRQPKSLHYLLQLYRGSEGGPDVPQMLAMYVEKEKTRSRKRLEKQLNVSLTDEGSGNGQQLDDYLLNDTTIMNGEDSYLMSIRKPLTKGQMHMEKVMRDIEKIKLHRGEAKDRKILEEELRRVKEEQLKVQAKKKVERIQLEHGVLPKKTVIARGLSVDNSRMAMGQHSDATLDKDGRPIEIKIIKARDLDELSEIPQLDQDHNRLSLLPPDEQRRQNPKAMLKQLKEFQLFDLRYEEQKDQDAVRYFVKKCLKALKALFAKYANTSGPINTVQHTFEDLQKMNANMTVSEAMRMLKDFNITTLQASQKDVMQMFRAINKDILKKAGALPQLPNHSATPQSANPTKLTVGQGAPSGKGVSNALMTSIDFEGFVEFLMQLAVHLYSYDSAMTPVEYLKKLFDTFAQTKGNNLGRLFQPSNEEEGSLTSGIADNKLLAELNKRLAQDPSYQLPEGYTKVTEKQIENRYTIPDYFPVKHSKRVVVEVFDGLLNDLFGIHILEPMSELREFTRARPIIKQMIKDKVMSEVAFSANKHSINAIATKRGAAGVQRQSRPHGEKASNSTDANPISKQQKLAGEVMKRDMSKAEISKGQPMLNIKNEQLPRAAPKPMLNPIIKLEIAKQPAATREAYLDAAYALEEVLQAVEAGQTSLERLANGALSSPPKKPPNKLVEDRLKKVEQDAMKAAEDRKKLDERKRQLKEQLDKMKEEKKKKDKEEKAKAKQAKAKEDALAKKRQEKLQEDLGKLKVEFSAKREAKRRETEKKKAQEPAQLDPEAKKELVKAQMAERKNKIIEELEKKQETRKTAKEAEEAKKARKEMGEKAKAEQIKKMYQETKLKARELKQRYREEYDRFYSSQNVQAVYNLYEKSLMTFMEVYSKFDGVPLKEGQAVTLSYNAYMNMGKKLKLYPDIVSSQDYVYIYKSMMKTKKKAENAVKYETLQDVQGTKLNFQEFKEVLLKIACLGKYKIPSGLEINQDEIRMAREQERQKKKEALMTAAASGVLKKPKDEFEEGHVNEDLINMFEKEFEVGNMTEKTIENLFKNNLLLKPEKPTAAAGEGKSGGGKVAAARGGVSPDRTGARGLKGASDDSI